MRAQQRWIAVAAVLCAAALAAADAAKPQCRIASGVSARHLLPHHQSRFCTHMSPPTYGCRNPRTAPAQSTAASMLRLQRHTCRPWAARFSRERHRVAISLALSLPLPFLAFPQPLAPPSTAHRGSLHHVPSAYSQESCATACHESGYFGTAGIVERRLCYCSNQGGALGAKAPGMGIAQWAAAGCRCGKGRRGAQQLTRLCPS